MAKEQQLWYTESMKNTLIKIAESTHNQRFEHNGMLCKLTYESPLFTLSRYQPEQCASFSYDPRIVFAFHDEQIQLLSYYENAGSVYSWQSTHEQPLPGEKQQKAHDLVMSIIETGK